MKAKHQVLGLVAIAAFLGGCGGGGGSSDAGRSPTSSAPTSSSAAAYAESSDCRHQVDKIQQISDNMLAGSRLAYDSFKGQVARIESLQKLANTTCSPKVMVPMTKATFQFSLVNFYWGACGTTKPCKDAYILSKIHQALATESKTFAAASRQS